MNLPIPSYLCRLNGSPNVPVSPRPRKRLGEGAPAPNPGTDLLYVVPPSHRGSIALLQSMQMAGIVVLERVQIPSDRDHSVMPVFKGSSQTLVSVPETSLIVEPTMNPP